MYQLDRLAVWCLVTTVRAHVDVGILRERRDLGKHLYRTCPPNG